MPIDINLLRAETGKLFTPNDFFSKYFDLGNNPDVVKKSLEARFQDPKIVDEIIEIDNEWRKCKYL